MKQETGRENERYWGNQGRDRERVWFMRSEEASWWFWGHWSWALQWRGRDWDWLGDHGDFGGTVNGFVPVLSWDWANDVTNESGYIQVQGGWYGEKGTGSTWWRRMGTQIHHLIVLDTIYHSVCQKCTGHPVISAWRRCPTFVNLVVPTEKAQGSQ